jgi:sec-independent protein translocase protein TatA
MSFYCQRCLTYIYYSEIQKNVIFFLPLSEFFKNKICASTKLYIMGRIGMPEILIILVVVLLLFGGKKIPELMKGLGSGVNEFKKASKGEDDANAASKKEEEAKK